MAVASCEHLKSDGPPSKSGSSPNTPQTSLSPLWKSLPPAFSLSLRVEHSPVSQASSLPSTLSSTEIRYKSPSNLLLDISRGLAP